MHDRVSWCTWQVECSSLTGESDLVPASVDRKHDIPAEARNLVFMSSLAMNGEGRGIVVRTGRRYGGAAGLSLHEDKFCCALIGLILHKADCAVLS